MAEMLPQSQLPMVRLRLVAPFMTNLRFADREADEVLEAVGLSRGMLERGDVFVSAQTMYRLVEDLAVASGDPFAGVHVGQALDIQNWDPVADALANTISFGDFLLRFSIAANRDATSVVYTLETRRERATFTERRSSNFGVRPAHNDGFGVAYIAKILLLARGGEDLGDSVVAHVCDPGVIPPNFMGMRVASTNSLGFSITFPADWLITPLSAQTTVRRAREDERPTAPASAADALARVVKTHLADPSLNASRIAAIMGTSERTLARHLSNQGTSILRELTRLRMEVACEILATTHDPVSSVALRVGYGDAGTFSRAFRRCTGVSPSLYREQLSADRRHA